MTLDQIKGLLADLARPFALVAVSAATAASILRLSWVGADLSGAAVLVTAELGGLAVLFGAKSLENYRIAASNAEVEKVRAQASPPPAEALKPAPPADDGEIPPDQRVRL